MESLPGLFDSGFISYLNSPDWVFISCSIFFTHKVQPSVVIVAISLHSSFSTRRVLSVEDQSTGSIFIYICKLK